MLPTFGTAIVNGYDIHRDESKVRRSIGLATGSEWSFYFRLTGQQNLEFFGTLQGLRGRKLKQRVEEILKQVRLYESKDKPYMEYSAGMKKKLSLARALLNDPPVYLLDEPTASLDPQGTREVHQLIHELKSQGKTVLLTTHNMPEAEKLSDHIGILNRGQLIAVDTLENLRGLFPEAVIMMKLAQHVDLAQLAPLQSLACVTEIVARNGVVRIYNREPRRVLDALFKSIPVHIIEDIRVDRPSLEEIFMRLTGAGDCNV